MRIQLPLALLAVLPIAACVDSEQPVDDLDEVQAEIEKENGGYTTTDDLAAFGAENLYAAAAIEGDTAVVDELETDPTIIAMGGAAGVEAHDLVLVWGQLPADPTSAIRDWSGELRLSRGAMVVRRRIAFEAATDRVMPRTSRDLIEFRSVTRPASDGLVLRVFDPSPADADPIRLTYTSADGSRTHSIELRRLADGPVVVDAGEGDRLIAAGRRRNDACRHGAMRGRWHALAPNAGVYLGIVANAAGEPIGHVRGIYGQRRNGDSVLFGKFIARDGRFTGILNGHFNNGRFEARWLDRAGDHGVVHGAYFEGATLRAGGFVARWAETSCDAN